MPEPRLRRLEKELMDMQRLEEASSLISFTTHGNPPTKYTVSMSCYGLCKETDTSGVIIYRTGQHAFEIILDQQFPHVAPQIVWKTPIFHPNFRGTSVCVGDFWYPGWSIAELCVALCEMVQYKHFNLWDPLDPEAALWLLTQFENPEAPFPVDHRPVRDLHFAVTVKTRPKGDQA